MRTPETLEWVFRSTTYRSWVEGDCESTSQNLEYVGILGCGKSVLASVVIEDLRNHCGSATNPSVVLYAYFEDKDTELTVPVVLADLLSQLIVAQEATSEMVQQLHRERNPPGAKNTKETPSEDSIMAALRHEISDFSSVYIVIDALDVISLHDQLQLVKYLLPLKARLMITSRYQADAPPGAFSRLNREDKVSDVRIFIEDRAKFLSSTNHPFERSPMLMNEIIKNTIATSDGMFSRARYVMDLFTHRQTETGIRQALDDLPKEFGLKVYKPALKRIYTRCAEDLQPSRIFYWVALAKRALTVKELQYALTGRDLGGGKKRPRETDVLNIDYTLRACDGFIEVKEDGVHFSHTSIRDFFKQNASEIFKVELAQIPIVNVCLCHLIRFFSSTEMPVITYHTIQNRLDDFPLVSYAASEWGYHAFDAESTGSVDKKLIDNFFRHAASPYVASSARTYIHPPQGVCPRAYKLLFLARYGLNSLLTEQGTWADVLNTQDAQAWTPLFFAVAFDHPKVVATLLDHGADPNIADGEGKTPLRRAAFDGFAEVANKLISAGAVVDVQDDRGWTPLHAAVIRGRPRAAETLLQKAANPNIADKEGRMPLHHAASKGYDKIVSLLINKDALVDAVDRDGYTPLLYAAASGHSSVVAALLKKQANPNAISRNEQGVYLGRTALHLAAEGGHSGVVAMLLKHGAEVNALDKGRRTALLYAVAKGDTQIMKILIEGGADPRLASEAEETPITQAAFRGYTDIFTMFLDAGVVNPAAVDSTGRGVISYAAEGGSVDVLKLLLDSSRLQLGQDEIDKPDKQQRAPISYAIRPRSAMLESGKRPMSGNVDVVKLLLRLSFRLDLNRVETRGHTPLLLAKNSKYREMRRIFERYDTSASGI